MVNGVNFDLRRATTFVKTSPLEALNYNQYNTRILHSGRLHDNTSGLHETMIISTLPMAQNVCTRGRCSIYLMMMSERVSVYVLNLIFHFAARHQFSAGKSAMVRQCVGVMSRV